MPTTSIPNYYTDDNVLDILGSWSGDSWGPLGPHHNLWDDAFNSAQSTDFPSLESTLDSAILPEATNALHTEYTLEAHEQKMSDTATSRAAASKSQRPSSKTSGTSTDKKRAHYAVEKRYRERLNQKITALGQMLPPISKSDEDSAESNDFGDSTDLDSLDNAIGSTSMDNSTTRLNKAVVLDRAIEYIQHLQEKTITERTRSAKLEERLKRCLSALDECHEGS
jgi:hypothetical protein